MKHHIQKYLLYIFCFLLMFSITGCSKKKEKQYENYVKSLIGINYLGATDDYIKATNANKEDAIALYNANIGILTDSILKYYGITLSDDSELMEDFKELSKNIYSKVNYNVSNAYEVNGVYKVDVEIKPINIFVQTKDAVIAHIEDFNNRVSNGDFNEYTVDEYNDAFSAGILDILNKACENIEYSEPQTVTVCIVNSDRTFYISDEDFLAIDAQIINIPSSRETTEE